MNILRRQSPNFEERDGQLVDMLVMHYTGMQTAEGALTKLCDPNSDKRVSAHYMVDEDGTVYQMVAEDKRAWHAGISSWRGNSNINQRSIGIEIVNPGKEYGYRPFPKVQMEAVAELSKGILSRHAIPSWNVVGHSDIAPGRKNDPGELFDWRFLSRQGIGNMPALPQSWFGRLALSAMRMINPASTLEMDMKGSRVLHLQKRLSALGYSIDINGHFDIRTQEVIKAFQQHFRPQRIHGKWDDECDFALESLLKQTPFATVSSPGSRMAASIA